MDDWRTAIACANRNLTEALARESPDLIALWAPRRQRVLWGCSSSLHPDRSNTITPAYYRIISASPSLRDRDPDPAALVGRLGTASSGESVMIRAALSLIPASWLAEDGIEAPPLRLMDVSSLDSENARALLEAIAVAAGHLEVLDQTW